MQKEDKVPKSSIYYLSMKFGDSGNELNSK